MDTAAPPTGWKTWAGAKVAAARAASRAASIDVLAADALATVKAQQQAVAAWIAAVRAEAQRDGWIAGEDALADLRAWIAEDEAEVVAA